MTSRISKLVLAAALASSLPAAAAARDCDGDRVPAIQVPAWPVYPAQPAYAQPDYGPAYGTYPSNRHWRDHGWRERELEHLRAEFRELDETRAAFYARPRWNPWRARRFERWYAERRAELELRWNELQAVAWR